jgi:protein Tex
MVTPCDAVTSLAMPGASVLSVSESAAAADPDLDVGARGAASIARRLQDPLSELVKVTGACSCCMLARRARVA